LEEKMSLKSLDPRITRLNILTDADGMPPKSPMDQFETYQSFHQLKEGKPYESVGIVHAPNEEMALLFAKEQYSRRGMFCSGIWIVSTDKVKISPFTDGTTNVYNAMNLAVPQGGTGEAYEVFHLKKRGKAHFHAGTVLARSHEHALMVAKAQFESEILVLNVLVAKKTDINAIAKEDVDIWNTLIDKKYRDATAWKAADKIKAFKEENSLKLN